MYTEVKLKSCPFCGGCVKPQKIRHKGSHGYCIMCAECRAKSEEIRVKQWHDNKYVAICQAAKRWNTRPEVADDATS